MDKILKNWRYWKVLKVINITSSYSKSQCIKDGTLFQDDKFPPTYRSLYFEPEKIQKAIQNLIQWQRPKEIVDEPHFYVDGINKNDINQVCCMLETRKEKKEVFHRISGWIRLLLVPSWILQSNGSWKIRIDWESDSTRTDIHRKLRWDFPF